MIDIPIKPTGLSIDITRSGKLHLTLKAGEVVSAKVINATINSLATLLIKNKVVEVKSSLDFKKGDKVLLKVESASAKSGDIRLSLVDSAKAQQTNAVKEVLSTLFKASGAAKLMQSEISSFKSLVLNMDTALVNKVPSLKALNTFLLPIEDVSSRGGEGIKRAISSSGIFFEAKLASESVKAAGTGILTKDLGKEAFSALLKKIGGDFKGALLRLRAALKEVETIEILKLSNIKPEELALKVDKLLKNIEFFQIQSKLNDTLELFIPFFWKSLRDGELILSESYKGPSESKSYSCTINLDFESTGRVSAIVLLMYDSIHLSFIAQKKEFIALINENSGALKSTFRKLGLTLGSIRASREEIKDFKEAHKSFEEGFNVKA